MAATPVVLTGPEALPAASADALARRSPAAVTVVGAEAAVGAGGADAVAELLDLDVLEALGGIGPLGG